MHADDFSRTQQCAEVLRIVERVQQQDEERFAAFFG